MSHDHLARRVSLSAQQSLNERQNQAKTFRSSVLPFQRRETLPKSCKGELVGEPVRPPPDERTLVPAELLVHPLLLLGRDTAQSGRDLWDLALLHMHGEGGPVDNVGVAGARRQGARE